MSTIYQSDRSLKDRVVVVSGASRGIGREIAVRVCFDGAKVALLAKTDTPHPKIPGTHAAGDRGCRGGGRWRGTGRGVRRP